MLLNRIDDPRDNLQKMSRDELYFYAQAKGVTEIEQTMPAVLMMKILRQRGLPGYDPGRILGMPPGYGRQAPDRPEVAVPEVDAEDLLMQQWASQREVNRPVENIETMPMGKLKKLAKERGVKQARTDNRETLLEKIRGQNAA